MPLTSLTDLPVPGPTDTPDGPGAIAALAKALQTYILLKNTATRTVANSTTTVMTWDALVSNPSGDMGSGGANISLPRAGVYRVHATTTINGGNNTTAPWYFDVKIFNPDGTSSLASRKGGFGWLTDVAIDFEAEVLVASPGSTMQIEFFQQSGSTTTHPGYNDPLYQQKAFVQYLGRGA